MFTPIYGYERGENDKPRVIPEQAAVVRRIFQSYLAGSSVPDIKRMLEAEGIAAAGGKPQWSVGALQYMLRNEKYCGDALLQKTFVENCISKKTRKNNGELPKYLVQNHHEAIIDRTLFEKVQAEIARRAGKRKVSDKTSKTGQSKYSGRYALTELLICGNCGTPYKRVTWSKRGKKKIVWRCISRLDYGTKYCKSSPTVDEERLQAAVLKAINTMMSNRERLIGILKTNLEITLSEKSSGATNPYAIENRIRELQDSMMELVAVAAKAGNAESYEDQFKEISEEIKSLQKTLEQYQAEQNGPDELARQIDDICKALEDAPFEITEYSNNIVRQFIDTIKVVNEDKLLFIFKGGITMEQPLTI
jgi:site-specific DNA recombinase